MRMVLLQLREQAANGFAHGSGPLRTAARNHRRAQRFREPARDVFIDEHQGADQSEILGARPRHRRQRTDAAREQSVSQERFAEIVRGMPERDYVCTQSSGDFVDSAAAIAAAQVAAVVRLLLEEPERRPVAIIRPVDAALLQIFAERLNRTKEFPLLDRERAYREIDWCALLQQQQRLQQSQRIFAARQRNGHTVAVADHLEPSDRLADLTQQDLL